MKTSYVSNHGASKIRAHYKTQMHITNKEKKKSKQTFIEESFQNSNVHNQFSLKIAKVFLESGIPLNKLNHPSLRSFLGNELQKKMPDESTLRKQYLDAVYYETLETIKHSISDFPVYFIMDESSIRNRYLLNIFVGPLTTVK
jgi:hypothetical protein